MRKYKIRRWLILTIGFLVFWTLVAFLIKEVGFRYARQAFNERLQKQIPENYRLNYESIELNFWEKTLNVNGVLFFPDSLRHQPINERLFQFYLPALRIQLSSITAIILEKKLLIEGLSVVDPEIRIKDFKQPEETNVTGESVSLFKLITKYLRLFEIQLFEIEDARFQYDFDGGRPLDKLMIEELDFVLKRFLVDSTLTRRKFLNAESVELIINKEAFFLNDHLHKLEFDQFRLSSQDSILTFKNIRLQPINEIFQRQPKNDEKSIYDIRIPELSIQGIDYRKTYLQKDLNISRVELKNPVINISRNWNKTTTNTGEEEAIIKVLSKLAPKLQIDHICLNDALLNFDIGSPEGFDMGLNIDYINIYDFHLNPEDLFFTKDDPPFRNFDLQLRNVFQKLPGDLHQGTIGNLIMSSKEAHLIIENLNIQPVDTSLLTDKPFVFQKIPRFTIQDIDYIGLFFGDPFLFSSIELQAPQTRLLLPRSNQASQQAFSVEQLKKAFESLGIPFINIRRLNIANASLEVDQLLKIENYTLEIQPFKLGRRTKSLDQIAQSLNLSIEDVSYKSDSVNIALSLIKTDGKNHYLRKTAVDFLNHSLSFNSQIPSIIIKNSPLDSLINKKYAADSILIKKPQFQVQLFKPGNRPNKPPSLLRLPFKANGFSIEKAGLKLSLPDQSQLQFKELNSFLEIDTISKLIDLSLKDFNFQPASDSLPLSIGRVRKIKGEKSSYEINDIKLGPKTKAPSREPIVEVHRLQIMELDRNKFWDDKIVAARKLVLDNSNININLDELNATASKDKNPPIPIIMLDSVTLSNGAINLISPSDSLDILIPDFKIQAQNINTENIQSKAESFRKAFAQLQLQAPEGIQIDWKDMSTRAGSFSYDSDLEAIHLENLIFQYGVHPFQVSSFKADGLDIPKLMEQQGLSVNNIEIDQLKFLLEDPREKKQASVSIPTKLLLPKNLSNIDVHSFSIHNSDFLWKREHPLQVNGINLLIENIKVNEFIDLKHLEEYMSQAYLGIEELKFPLGPKSEYELSQSVQFHSREEQLISTQFSLHPRLPFEAHNELLGYRNDYLRLSTDSIVIHHFKWSNLLQPVFHTPRIDLKKVGINILRDERMEFWKREKPLIQSRLKSIPYPFLIDTLNVDGDLIFTAIAKQSELPAQFSIDQLAAQLRHLTNQDSLFDTPLELDGEGLLYGEGRFDVNLDFKMNDSLDAFQMKGRIGRMDLRLLNQIITPEANLRIQRGKAREIDFKISANSHYAIGEMYFLYNKLRLRLVDKKDNFYSHLGNSILSFWANQIVKSNNPGFWRKRKGFIFYERNPHREITSYWVHSLLGGAVSSIGVKNNKRKLKKMGINDLKALRYEKLFNELFRKD